MTPTQCVDMVDLIRALCPAQKIDEYTPDAWFPLLQDVAIEDAVDAVYAAKRDGVRFVDVVDVLDGVRLIEDGRVARVPSEDLIPAADPDDVPAYLGELRRLGEGARSRPGGLVIEQPLRELNR